jgi:hypothetical protein
MPPGEKLLELATQLLELAKILRAAGDLPLVVLSEEGVTPQHLTLADEIELVAISLNVTASEITT